MENETDLEIYYHLYAGIRSQQMLLKSARVLMAMGRTSKNKQKKQQKKQGRGNGDALARILGT